MRSPRTLSRSSCARAVNRRGSRLAYRAAGAPSVALERLRTPHHWRLRGAGDLLRPSGRRQLTTGRTMADETGEGDAVRGTRLISIVFVAAMLGYGCWAAFSGHGRFTSL